MGDIFYHVCFDNIISKNLKENMEQRIKNIMEKRLARYQNIYVEKKSEIWEVRGTIVEGVGELIAQCPDESSANVIAWSMVLLKNKRL